MRPVILLAPLLLAACGGHWPVAPYLRLGDADPVIVAPAVSDCIAEIVPPKAAVVLPAEDALTSVLTDDLKRNGIAVRADGQPVTYIIAPADTGEFIRVTAPHGICSQYLARVSGTLRPAGPLMVATQ
jgi:hypothetical protein